MNAQLPRAFAELAAHLEDMHGLAVEGQRRDNAEDMQRVLVGHLRSGLVVLNSRLSEMTATLYGRAG